MEISLNIENNWLIIDLNGRIDSFNYELVTDQVNTLLKMGKKKIAVELSDVVFLNLPSLRFFSGVAERLSKSGGALCFINPDVSLHEHIGLFNRKNLIQIVGTKADLLSLKLEEISQ